MDTVVLAESAGAALLVALVVAIVVVGFRRSALARSGAIDICWRRDLALGGRGWVLGQGRFRENEFLLYRSFSPFPGAARRLRRDHLVLGDRRGPTGTEPDLLPPDAVIIRCTHGGTPIELALGEEALTGLRSWLESMPPATRSVRTFHRGGGKN